MICSRICLIILTLVISLIFSSPVSEGPIVENFSVAPFLDDNHYIRLNLTWTFVLNHTHTVSIRFRNSEDCNPINDIENYNIENNQYLIIPSMDMEHPADTLVHRCVYEITLENEDYPGIIQRFDYEVPECVGDRCACKDPEDSPWQLESITPQSEDYYSVKWKAKTTDNLTIHTVSFQRANSETKTFISVKDIQVIYGIDSMKVPLHDLKTDVDYSLFIAFNDLYNECIYVSSINLKVPGRPLTYYSAITILVVLVLVIMTVIGMMFSTKIRKNITDPIANLHKYILSYIPEDYQMPIPLAQAPFLMENNMLYTTLECTDGHQDKYEVSCNRIKLDVQIGEGAFGKVYKGKMHSMDHKREQYEVAVKMLREGASSEEKIEFQNEIEILKRVGEHENIVRLLACVLKQEPNMMIMELVSGGSLKNYLLKLRAQWKKKRDAVFSFPDISDSSYIEPNCNRNRFPSESGSLPPRSPMSLTSSKQLSSSETVTTEVDLATPLIRESVFDSNELHDFAAQICRGMAFLENKGITHRDLAARNILITSERKNILKISDFGLSRKGTYVSSKGKKLPLRWMSIEAIEDRICDSKSDVWSFGIVLWEIGTLGAFPYETAADNRVFHDLKMGKRLERPEICTDQLYSLMMRCWAEKPTDRPSFAEILDILNVEKKVYIEFSALNPEYMFPPCSPHDVS